jgi:hypothetical protein
MVKQVATVTPKITIEEAPAALEAIGQIVTGRGGEVVGIMRGGPPVRGRSGLTS